MKNNRYGQDGKQAFHILISLIQVWNEEDGFMTPPVNNTLSIAEVEEVDISDSYKQVINKASVRFPRGTVIRKTMSTIEATLDNAGAVTASLDDRGVLLNTHTTSAKIAGVADFSPSKRIRIYLGYTNDPKIAELPKFNGKRKTIFTDSNLYQQYFDAIRSTPNFSGPLFDGYITKCSLDTPIELECEDLGCALRQVTVRNIPKKNNMTVKGLFGDKGILRDVLDKAGLKLDPHTPDINIGPIELNEDLTLADVLNTWNKFHLYSYIWVDYSANPPQPYLCVGRSYFTNSGDDSIIKQKERQGFQNDYTIDFNYNVANNGLTLTGTDKDFLCIKGTGMGKDGKALEITIRQNPEWTDGQPAQDKYQILNETNLTKKQKRAGMTSLSKAKNKGFNPNQYEIRTYASRKMGITREELLKETIEYFDNYKMTGIDGTLTLFGDLQLVSGLKVKLVDPYYPAKKGTYFVDEVTTKFGNGGFRQTIKIPFCISRDNDGKNNK